MAHILLIFSVVLFLMLIAAFASGRNAFSLYVCINTDVIFLAPPNSGPSIFVPMTVRDFCPKFQSGVPYNPTGQIGGCNFWYVLLKKNITVYAHFCFTSGIPLVAPAFHVVVNLVHRLDLVLFFLKNSYHYLFVADGFCQIAMHVPAPRLSTERFSKLPRLLRRSGGNTR